MATLTFEEFKKRYNNQTTSVPQGTSGSLLPNNNNVSFEEFKSRYSADPVTQPAATPTQTMPKFKTLAEAEAYAQANNINAVNTGANIPTLVQNAPQTNIQTALQNAPQPKPNAIGQTFKNIGIGGASTTANILEHLQDNNQMTAYQDSIAGIMAENQRLLDLGRGKTPKERLEILRNTNLGEESKRVQEERAQARYEDTDRVTQALRDARTQAMEDTSKIGGLGGKVAEAGLVVGDMLPTIGAGIVGGPLASNATLFMNAKQNAYNQAIENGATHEQAYWNSMLSAGAETGIEMLSGGALNKLADIPGVANVSKWTKGIKSPLLRGTVNLSGDVGGEGLEEGISAVVQPLIDRITYNKEAPLATFKDVLTSFGDSVIPTLMFGGIRGTTQIRNGIEALKNKQIQELENSGLSQQEITEMKAKIEEMATEETERIEQGLKNDIIAKIQASTLSEADKQATIADVNSMPLTQETYNAYEKFLKDFQPTEKQLYARYLKDTRQWNTTALSKAKQMTPRNSRTPGKYTKDQWLKMAREFGANLSENDDVELNAYKSWQSLRPNQKESLNRQGRSYVSFTLQEWQDAIQEGAKTITPTVAEQTTQQSISDVEQTAPQLQNMEEQKTEKIGKSLVDIANLTEEDSALPDKKYKYKTLKYGDKQRGFFENVETSKIVSQDVKDRVEMTNYNVKHNEDVLNRMNEKLDKDGAELATQWFGKDIKKFTDEDVALGAILLERYQQEGRFENAVDIIQKLADVGTEAGRTVQMYSIFQRMTPEAMQIYQQRKLSSALETMSKKKTGEWVKANQDKFKLTAEDAEFIQAKITEAQQAPTQRQKQIALGQIEARINAKLPPEAGQSVKAFRRIAMLFNPKTQVRNVAGNVAVMPLNTVTDLVATQIDKMVAKKTGVRTTGTMKANTMWQGAKKGAAESFEDYKLGIRTTPTGAKYEIEGAPKSFDESKGVINQKLNQIDRMLSFVLELGDRPFYEATYQNSLENQMRANGVTEPTQEMIDIAVNEGLERTWQDNNNYTKAVLSIRNALNTVNVKGFGLGDILIPFAKTPANLTKAMVDYSPVGFIDSIIKYSDMQKAISRGEFTAAQQKKFVNSVGKAAAGTMLYALASALVQSGSVTGSADDDKDVANFEKNVLGIQPYSIKVGDKTFTYNWAQPIATPFAVMADTYKMSKEKESAQNILLNAFQVAGDQLVANSFLQGIQELFSTEYAGITENIIGTLLDIPSQFTPTLFGQVASQMDSTQRQTFEKGDKVQTSVNKVKAKIPGLKNTLAPQVNTFGEEIQSYGGLNNPFNVFLNPANISEANATETQKELYSLYEATKDKTIFPKQAPYTVEGGGEKIDLSSNDRAEYQKISGQYTTEVLDALFDSKFYQELDNNTKVKVVNKVVSDADTTAKDNWVDTKATQDLAERKAELGNIPLADYYLSWIAYQGAEGKKNNKGKTISGTKKTAQKKAINEATSDLTKAQQKVLYGIFNLD